MDDDVANDFPNCSSCIYFIGGFFEPCDYHTLSCWEFGSWNLWTSGEECGTNPPPMDYQGQVNSWNNNLFNNLVRLNSCVYESDPFWHEASMKSDLIIPVEPNETYTLSFYAYGNSLYNPNFASIPLTFAFANSENLASLNQLDFTPGNALDQVVFEISDNNQWNYYTTTFSYNGSMNASKIWVGITPDALNFSSEGAIADLLLDNLTLVQHTECSLGLSSFITPTSCPQRSDGSIDLTISGNVCDVTYSWTGPVSGNTEDMSNLPSGSYTVTVSDQLCSITETFVVGSLQATSIPPITSQALADLWLNNQTVYVNGDVIFDPPITTYLIHDCHLLFNSGENLIINEGSGVSFSYVELDACGSSWGGIDIKSNNTTPSPAGSIKSGDHLIIRHADTGIFTRDAGNTQTNFANYQCGWMNLTNSEFIDNKRAVYIRRGNNYFTSIGGTSTEVYFENCTFEWTPDIMNHFPNFYSSFSTLRMVEIEDYNGATFKDCQLSNATTEGNWNRRGAGIYFYRSKVNLVGSLTATNFFEISGFNIGVRGNTATTQNTGSIIRGLQFKQNKVGINTITVNDVSLIENQIHVGSATTITALDNSSTKYVGIQIDGGTNYTVTENNILGHISGGTYNSDNDTPHTKGIAVNNSMSTDDEIYFNKLQSLNWAHVANRNNRTGIGGGGLRYVCNTNLNNDHDFSVADITTNGTTVISSIATVQSDLPDNNNFFEISAGNTFTQGNTLTANDFSVDAASSAITYRYYNGASNEIPTSINQNVTATQYGSDGITLNDQNLCQSEISLLVNPDLSINWSNLNDIALQRDAARIDWLAAKYTWITLIDGGDTEILREEISSGYSTDTWTERAKLLDYSPYLSEAVLYDVADNTVLFPHPIALEIILANPQILQNKLFIEHLGSKTDPMPEYMLDILLNMEDIENSRTILESQLRAKHSTYLSAAKKVLSAKVQDPTFTTGDYLNELRQWQSVPAYLAIIDYLMDMQDYTTISEEWENLQTNCKPSKELTQDLATYETWMDLRMRLSNDEIDLTSMPQFYLDEMISLAENDAGSSGGIRAAAMLHANYEAEYKFEPVAPMEPLTSKSMKVKKSAKQNSYLSAFPNPTSDVLNLRLAIPEYQFKTPTIRIYDITGKLFQEYKVQYFDQIFTLNTTDWPAGSYEVTLSTDNCTISHNSIVLVK